MFDLELRKLQHLIFLPIAKTISKTLTPNELTILGFMLGVLSSVSIYFKYQALSVVLFIFNRAFDALDGSVARLTNSQTDFGGYLDIIADFIVYSLIPISITLSYPTENGFKALFFLLASYYVNSASLFQLSAILEKRNLGARVKKEKTSVNMPPAVRAI